MKSRGLVPTAYILFLGSGMTGLAYEVIWTRLLVRVFGATSFAVTTVLASYMAGLALGSYLLGRAIDRGGKPIRVYGLLELGIGVFALIFPFLIAILNPFYGQIYPGLENRFYLLTTVRFILCFGVLLIPATLMGGTLPILSKYVTRSLSHLTERVGSLYAINTVGAVAGTFGTAFYLLPRLGIRNTTWLCAAVNFVIFGIAFLMSTRRPEVVVRAVSPAEASGEVPIRIRGRLVLIAFMITGFCALSIEVVWTRVLSLVIGTTVYAFSTMLTSFLFGLALGSWVFSKVAQKSEHPGRIFGFIVGGIGVAVLLSSVSFGRLPILYMSFFSKVHPDWGDLIWVQFLLCFLTMLLPTFLMGGTFPLVARLYAKDVSHVGGQIGTVYAFNTVGSIIGSVAGSFLFLRVLGVERSLLTLSAVYLGVGALLLLTVARFRSRRFRWVGVAGVLIAGLTLLVFSPGWDRRMMTSGVYRYSSSYGTAEDLKESLKGREILFYDEGPGATVAVVRSQDKIRLVIDGKTDASTDIGDMEQQVLLAHLPLLFHPEPETVLVIGLGSGVSLGSAERFEAKSIDCVELLENVVEASRYFDQYTYECLTDPRVNMIIGDGRNHVLLTDKKYDVIITEPTNPWISGVGDLFTQEYFEMVNHRLKPGGVVCAWFQTYHMGVEDLQATFKAFLSVFDEVTLWMANDSDMIFLGSGEPLRFEEMLAVRFENPAIVEDLKRVRIDEPEDILSCFISGSAELRSFASHAPEPHTDDNMLLEFSAGRKLTESTKAVHISNFVSMMTMPPLDGSHREVIERVDAQMQARRTVMSAALAKVGGRPGEALALYDSAYAAAPFDHYVLSEYIINHLAAGDVLLIKGDYLGAADHYRKSLVDPGYPESGTGYYGLGLCYFALGDYANAHENLRLSIAKNPYNVAAHYAIGRLELIRGNRGAAITAYQKALDLMPEHADAANQLARVYAESGQNLAVAERLAEAAIAAAPRAQHYNTLSWVYHRMGKLTDAKAALEKALAIRPDNSETLLRLASIELAMANTERARSLLQRLVALGRNDEYSQMAARTLRELEVQH